MRGKKRAPLRFLTPASLTMSCAYAFPEPFRRADLIYNGHLNIVASLSPRLVMPALWYGTDVSTIRSDLSSLGCADDRAHGPVT